MKIEELSGIFDQQVSLFRNAQITDKPQRITLKELLRNLRDGTYAEQVTTARDLLKSGRTQYDNFKKKNVAGFTLSAYCNHRKSDANSTETERQNKLINHTGLLQIDIDKIGKEHLPDFRRIIEADKHTLFCFVSLSGEGLKAGIVIDGNNHLESFRQAERYYKETYNLVIDTSVKDVFRLCFVSYDADLFVNPHAEKFTIQPATNRQDSAKTQQPKSKPRSAATNDRRKKYAEKALDTAKKILNESVKGNRHDSRLRAGELLGGYVAGNFFSKDYAMNEIQSTVSKNTSLAIETAMKDISDGIEHGIETPITFEDLEAGREDFNRKNGHSQRKKDTGHTERNQDTGDTTEPDIPYVFWYETENSFGKLSLKIKYAELYGYLKSIGIKKLEIDNSELRRALVRIVDNVVSEIDLAGIRNILNDYVDSLPDIRISDNYTKTDLREILTKGISQYLNDAALDFNIPFQRIDFLQDSKDKAFFFFRNGFIEVSKDGIIRKPHTELHGFIWESQIIAHDFEVIPDSEIEKINNFDFVKWSKNICSIKEPKQLDTARYKALICTIGYLLHTFKKTANRFAVILTEATIDDDQQAQGQTGKGLLIKSLNKLRRVDRIDGKNFTFDSPFAFQNANLDTQILFLDDTRTNFDFRRLYSVITEGLSYEKKNQHRVNLPPEKSPKIVITTNHGLQGNSESDKARKFEMELLPYYDSNFRPEHDFGEQFFYGWNAEQWNTFYNFMLNCVGTYLQNGNKIPAYSSETVAKKKLLVSTDADFVQYADNLPRNEDLSVNDTYAAFLEFSGTDKKEVSKQRFGKWLKVYCEYKNLKYNKETRRNGNKTEGYHHLKEQESPS